MPWMPIAVLPYTAVCCGAVSHAGCINRVFAEETNKLGAPIAAEPVCKSLKALLTIALDENVIVQKQYVEVSLPVLTIRHTPCMLDSEGVELYIQF